MQVTKYPQSNFLIEKDNTRILIDPGVFTFEKFTNKDFGHIDAILITHQHPDHLDLAAIKFWAEKDVPIFGNSDVKQILKEQSIEAKEVKSEDEFEFGSFKVKPVDITHFQQLFCTECNSTLVSVTPDKKCALHPSIAPQQIDGPPNTGFLLDTIFFHPGDGIEATGLKVAKSAIPIAGPTVTFDRAWELVTTISTKTIIPMHYSSPKFPADPVDFALGATPGVEVRILADGESLKL